MARGMGSNVHIEMGSTPVTAAPFTLAAWGFTCPHNKEPVQACADCGLSGSVSFGFTSPEAASLQTTLFFERKYQLQLTVQHNNPDHKCTVGNPACRKAG